jgi:hypothetical protein
MGDQNFTIFDAVQSLKENDREIVLALHSLAERLDCRLDVRGKGREHSNWTCTYRLPKVKRIFFVVSMKENELHTKLILLNIGKYIDVVKTYPQNIQDILKNANNCGDIPVKCALRPEFELDGVQYIKCSRSTFCFDPVKNEQVPYFVSLLEMESKYWL